MLVANLHSRFHATHPRRNTIAQFRVQCSHLSIFYSSPGIHASIVTMQALPTSTNASSPPFYISKSVNGKGESIGKGVFASRSFGAGEEVAALRRPLVGSLDSQYLQDTCANCYVWTEGASTGTRLYVPEGAKVQKCAGCQRFRYCSKVRFYRSGDMM